MGKLGSLLLVADYLYRGYCSLRVFVRFWSRARLRVPDADSRVEKASRIAIIGESWSKITTLMILHHLTKNVLLTFIEGSVVALMSSIYMPLLADYRVGCVERPQEGSWLGKTLYA